MDALTHPLPAQAAAPPAFKFGIQIATGLIGILLAVLIAGFNESVTKVAMADIRGAMGFDYDQGTWLIATYAATSVTAMAFAPWCAVTFTFRRFVIFAMATYSIIAFLCPFAPSYESLLTLRAVQGLMGGAMPPMLMSVALRYLPPNVKLYGLGAYALTATFGPSFGIPLAGWSVDYLGWQFAFWQVIPMCLLSMALVSWGMPEDPMKLERFKDFNVRGFILGVPAIIMIVLGLEQGQRLDWFNSDLIKFLILGGLTLLTLFLANEWNHPFPFFKVQLLKRRNLAHSLITLGGILFIMGATINIPSSYLAAVQGYRALDTTPALLIVAVPQFLIIPLVVAVLNNRYVDCRYVLAAGFALLAFACYLGSHMTSEWIRDNFYVIQIIQAFAQPMAVIPVIMLSVTGLDAKDGPFASAWFNTLKGFAGVAAACGIEVLSIHREHFHSTVLVDQLGNRPLHDSAISVSEIAHRVHEQVMTLTSADLYTYVGIACVVMIPLIAILPTRIYPPAIIK
ncbi:MFS transporter [Pseudomonas poae]|uniref:Drug resistance transporter, EmrB/QacA subfamily n=1 Tax=Pseudomonas poae TaxID=200451 RepID=A0ABY0RCS3_9PSED|nr:MFS transporter [Pseudomonas poae]KRP51162.1 DSBA oxidoreductase [Pseudomonas poae]SDN66798.1 drug resistance transporter, EmrB/QacA subfamily [Pseudomonas poae]